jgi:hypothetical protein
MDSLDPQQEIAEDGRDLREDISERLLRPAFGLGPFAFRAGLEAKYQAELNPDTFAQELREELADLQPSKDTIDFLYETCFDARIEKELMAKARTITGTDAWRASRKRLPRLIESLRGYENIEMETRLREELGKTEVNSITPPIAVALKKQLAELNWACECWEGFAKWAYWKRFYRGYVWNMDRRLRKEYEKQQDRTEIIAAAVRWMEVESQVSGDSIARCLRREGKVPKRFVFNGPLSFELVDDTDPELTAFRGKWSTSKSTGAALSPPEQTPESSTPEKTKP